MCGTAAEVSAVNSVDDRDIPCPGPMTTAIAAEYAKAVRGQVDRYKDWVEHVALNAPVRGRTGRRPGAARLRSRSSTRRCATAPSSRASRSPSRTSCASPSSSTGSASHWIEGGYPQANPKDEEFFRRAPHRAARSTTSTLVAFGSTRRPHGQGRRRPDAAPPWSAPAPRTVCIVGKSWDFHVTEALRTTLDEGVAMVGDSVALPEGRGPAGLLRRRALLRRLQGQPRVRAAGARGGGRQRRRLPGAVRHQRRLAAPRGAAHHRARSSPTSAALPIGIHTQNDTGCAVANSVAAVRRRGHPGAGHDQRLRRAHRQRQPHDGHPRPHAEAGRRDPARGPPRAAHRREPPRRRAGEPAAAPGRPVRRRLGVRPQGRAAHLGARPGRRRHLRAHRPRRRRQPHPGAGVRPRRPGRHVDEGRRSSASSSTTGPPPRSSEDLKQLESEG